MSHELDKELFTEAHWGEVQAFDCGDEVYELEVSDWLKGPFGEDSALTAIRHPAKPSKVWLYRLAHGTLVGFGAIGESHWRWKGKKDPKIPVTLIIWLAIAKQFQGQPEGPHNQRYSVRVLDDLIYEALNAQETHPIVGLCVHAENRKAIALYERYGFTEKLDPYEDKATGTVYMRMAIILNDEVLLQIKNSMTKNK